MIIQNLYKTIISVYSDNEYVTESYNINIGGTAYIKIQLLDYNDNPVIGEEVTVHYDTTTLITGTTDSNGELRTSTVCNKWGTHRITSNDTIENIQVKGYANYYTGTSNGANITIDYNEELVRIKVQGSIPVTTSWKDLYIISEASLRPNLPVNQIIFYGPDVELSANNSRGAIMIRDVGRSWTPGIGQEICYPRRTLDFVKY